MAKTTSKVKKSAPLQLALKLNAPGMTSMHRAGLGGLAATLNNLTKRKEKRELNTSLFSSPKWHEEFSWEIKQTEIIINFGKPEWAEDFFEWLFDFAFQIDSDKMIYLPGQYTETDGNSTRTRPEIRARLQSGLTLTFLQHGGTRKLGQEVQASYQHENKTINFVYKECQSYTHQTAWRSWINKKGELVLKSYEVQGPINPGAVVRHQAFSTPTKVTQPIELVLPLIFALVGTVTLPINRAVGALIVPYVRDLNRFAKRRPRITPDEITKTFVASAGDAALRFELECRGSNVNEGTASTGCDVLTFQPMPWSTQQKSRSKVLSVESLDEDFFEFYHTILQYFPPRMLHKALKKGRGKENQEAEEFEYFWADSTLRPFIADNIVLNKYWFSGFTALMNATDINSGKPIRDKINYERKGLNQMIKNEEIDWKLDGARSLVLAVHEALRCCYGKANADRSLSDNARKNRMEKEYEHWRIAFSGAKTNEQFRYALSDMFSRAKAVTELKNDWEKITHLLLSDWQSARDLALIGLASYKGKETETESSAEDSSLLEE